MMNKCRKEEIMKLIIQIPCYNESETLPVTLSALPRSVPGFDNVEWLVIDDGSTDDTVRVAKEAGADYIVRHNRNQGLARAFMTGIRECIRLGADVIVNTDADNQYCADDISALTHPVLNGLADLVVGARPIDSIRHFSPMKKILQKIGSWVVRIVSRTSVEDVTSGFRAFSRKAAEQFVVFSNYTYTLETLIQAGLNNMSVVSIQVRVNQNLRPSRLIKSVPVYIFKSLATIVRIFVIYRPFRFFAAIGLILFGVGFLLGIRFLYYYLAGHGGGHIQSLVLASVLLGMGFQVIMVAFVTDLLASYRVLLEKISFRQRENDDSNDHHRD
jgi:glycosyltransferase involved in cell wall biosynthesis